MSFIKLFLSLAVLPLILTQPALAHVVWFDYEDGKYELLFGHPEADETEPFDVSKFREATAYDLSKNLVPGVTELQEDNLFFVPESEIAALTAFYDNGFYRSNPDGTSDNLSPEEAAAIDYDNVTNFVKYTKGIYGWSDEISMPFGLPLEIMPLQNPLEVKAGENLAIQVLFNGSLIDNATVEYLGQELAVDENGVILVPVEAGGLEVIEASYNPNGNLDLPYAISYATTLSAELTSPSASVPEPSFLLGLSLIGGLTLLGQGKEKHKSNIKK